MPFDGISADAERLFVRLIMKADDYGRFHADPRLVRAGCFPLSESLRTNDLARWLDELSTRQLILRYENKGRKLLAIVSFRQRLKMSRAKFPSPEGQPDNYLPDSDDFPELPGSSGKFRPDLDSDSDLEVSSDTERKPAARGAQARVFPGPLNCDKFKKAWAEWETYRKQRRISPLTEIGIAMKFKEFSEWGVELAIEAINNSIKNNYQGIFPPRNGTKANGPSRTEQPQHDPNNTEF